LAATHDAAQTKVVSIFVVDKESSGVAVEYRNTDFKQRQRKVATIDYNKRL
jgi:alkylation response protein AidB-like acyl-CoA dehydrogenase